MAPERIGTPLYWSPSASALGECQTHHSYDDERHTSERYRPVDIGFPEVLWYELAECIGA